MRGVRSNDDSNPTRPSLLDAVRESDQHPRWQEFYDTYVRLIHGVARSRGLGEEDAQDVVQDTLASVARTMPDFKYDPAKCSFKTWLMHLTRCRIADQMRKRQRQPLTVGIGNTGLDQGSIVEHFADPEADLNVEWEKEWAVALGEAALERLKQQARPVPFQIFFLHCYRGQASEAVAQTLQVSRAYVYLTTCRLKPKFARLVRQLRSEWE